MHVVVAPDKFKGTLTASEVAARVTAGIAAVAPGVPVREVPVADGGDGTVDAALAAGFTRVPVRARGTGRHAGGHRVRGARRRRGGRDGRRVRAAAAPAGRAGRAGASSYGTGEVSPPRSTQGCHTVLLGIGGSASTDGGAGMLAALGARLLDADGAELPRAGPRWPGWPGWSCAGCTRSWPPPR